MCDVVESDAVGTRCPQETRAGGSRRAGRMQPFAPGRLARRVLLGVVPALLAVAGGSAVASDDPAGARDAEACEADIHRLCDTVFPDEKLVATCLVDQRAKLSRACAEVLARPPSHADDE